MGQGQERCAVCDDPACKREQAEQEVTAAVARYMEASQSPLFVAACELDPLDKKPQHVAEFDRVTGIRRDWEKAFAVMKRAQADCASRPAVDWRRRALDAEAKLDRLAEEGRELAIKARNDREALREAESRERWVPVGERLPTEGERVLIAAGGVVVSGALGQFGWWWSADPRKDHNAHVTHWRPMPAAPEVP